MQQSPSWEADSHSVKKFPAFYGTPRFITASTRARHWPVSWVKWTQSTPSHTLPFLRSILIFYSHLCPGLPSCLFPLGFSDQNFVYIFHLFHVYWPAERLLPSQERLCCMELVHIKLNISAHNYKSCDSWMLLLIKSTLQVFGWLQRIVPWIDKITSGSSEVFCVSLKKAMGAVVLSRDVIYIV
jgi:hypothetical protein